MQEKTWPPDQYARGVRRGYQVQGRGRGGGGPGRGHGQIIYYNCRQLGNYA